MDYLKKSLPYFAAPILALLIFYFYFSLWNVDLSKPLFNNYHWDSLLHAFFTKNIVDNGWFLVNKFVGLPHLEGDFYLYDFPLEAGSFNFLILKFYSLFTSNPFLILNLYFLTTIALIALTSFVVLRSFNISIFTSLLISILYDFLFYHIQRSIFHALLANYAAIPLVVMVAFWIIQNKIELIALNQKNQYCLKPNRYFFIALLVAVFVSASDVYYTLYACMFFMLAWLVQALQKGKFIDTTFFNSLGIILVILFALFCFYMPSITYWIMDGTNSNAANRSYNQSEYYALRIIDLLLPSTTHFIEYLANIRNFFDENIVMNDSAILERGSEALGILGAIGFIFLLFWLLIRSFTKSEILQKTIQKLSLKSSEVTFISNLAALNLLTVLLATVGGFIMFLVPLFSMLRSHCRFSIIIAFLSFLLIAIIFDKIIDKKIFNRKIYSKIIVLIIAILALFDQLGNPRSEKYTNPILEKKFVSDKNFIERIEAKIPTNSRIFVLPVTNFPEGTQYDSLAGYLHSKNLLWSYPSMRGRPSQIWQRKVSKLKFEDFIKSIKGQGFDGIFINRPEFAQQLARLAASNPDIKSQYDNRCKISRDLLALKEFETELDAISKLKLVSADADFSFFELR